MNLAKMIFGFFGLTILVFSPSFLGAEPVVPTKSAQVSLKSVRGPASVLRSKFIEIEYAQDDDGAHVMVFPLSEDIKIQNKRSIGDIQQGDTVELIYEQRTWLAEDGEEKSEVTPKEIRFLKAAPIAAPAENELISEETE